MDGTFLSKTALTELGPCDAVSPIYSCTYTHTRAHTHLLYVAGQPKCSTLPDEFLNITLGQQTTIAFNWKHEQVLSLNAMHWAPVSDSSHGNGGGVHLLRFVSGSVHKCGSLWIHYSNLAKWQYWNVWEQHIEWTALLNWNFLWDIVIKYQAGAAGWVGHAKTFLQWDMFVISIIFIQ